MMNNNTVEKFAELLSKCAVTGQAAALRKEAAAQQLIKEANPWLLAGPLAGAAAGGLGGYYGTEDEKRKKRNALYGMLSGGLLGLGAPLMFVGKEQAENAANTSAPPADKPSPAAAAATEAAVTNSGGGSQEPARKPPATAKEMFEPNALSEKDPRYLPALLNRDNIAAEAGAGGLGMLLGGGIPFRGRGGIGGTVGSWLDTRAYARSPQLSRHLLSEAAGPAPKPRPGQGPRLPWLTESLAEIRRLASSRAAFNEIPRPAPTTWGQRASDIANRANLALDSVRQLFGRGRPAHYAAAARHRLGLQGRGARQTIPNSADREAAVGPLARLARTQNPPTNENALAATIEAIHTLANKGRTDGPGRGNNGRVAAPATLREKMGPEARRDAARNPKPGAPPRPTSRQRIGRRAGGLAGAGLGTYLMSPEFSAGLLNKIFGDPALARQAEGSK